jgi:hypothetical protein
MHTMNYIPNISLHVYLYFTISTVRIQLYLRFLEHLESLVLRNCSFAIYIIIFTHILINIYKYTYIYIYIYHISSSDTIVSQISRTSGKSSTEKLFLLQAVTGNREAVALIPFGQLDKRYIYTYIFLYVYIYVYIYIWLCMCVYICIYIHIFIYLCSYVYVFINVYIYIYNVYTYTYMYILYMYIYIYMYIGMLRWLGGRPRTL